MQLERGVEPLLHQLLDTSKVVILEGGRGVGKTTLALKVAASRNFGTSFDLSDPADRSVLNQDAYRVLAASPAPILIDEAQLEPEITVAVKRLVDAAPGAGQVLLTGSARIGRGLLGGGDPLAGRAVRLRLDSFTQGELDGRPVDIVNAWRHEDPDVTVHPELSLHDLYHRMMLGGIPAVALAGEAESDSGSDHRRRLLTAYVEGVLTVNLAGTRTDQPRLMRTFRYLAANPGQILNLSRAASELSMRAETVQNYVDLCESSFLLDTALAHRPSQHKTVTAHPRVYASDISLAGWAAETSAARLVRDSKLAGAMFENFAMKELVVQASWSPSPASVLHWRDTRANKEVDLVLRWPNGDLVAVEFKSASSASLADARGLRAFAEAAHGRVVRSFIVYTGRVTQQLDEHIWAVPVASLWAPEGGFTPASRSG